MSTSGVEKHLSLLKEIGAIRRVGPDNGGHWEVVDND
jgi:predicted HTH transcriptional regulator